jgi:PTS system mannitol-specific IIC component
MNDNTFKTRVQKFGRFLSGMVMPNIGAFIAWGLITALFIPTGWMPNESLSALVGPMIIYLLPLLIGYTGGKMVAGQRGGVIGAIATMGVVVGVDIPMFIGAMIMGPLGGLAIKKTDELFEGNVKAGFEMLVANFSAGIVGMAVALLAYVVIGPVVLQLNTWLGVGVEAMVNTGALPLASVFIEPAKILFLNNAINHGVLGPLGIAESAELGKSIFFLLETNPGPGLGILLAYWVFAKGMVKQSAPGAIIIHFLGGIHEIYFPYVLMNPILVLAVIAGGASGVFTFGLLDAGLVATPSPGSIFALLAMTPKGNFFAVILGVVVSTVVSFLVASFFIKRKGDVGAEEFEAAKDQVVELKNKKEVLQNIVFACDAGMGSSAMGATIFEKKLKDKGVNVKVSHYSISDVPNDTDLIISHKAMKDYINKNYPTVTHIALDDLVNQQQYDSIVEKLVNNYKFEVTEVTEEVAVPTELLMKENIVLGRASESKEDAIRFVGSLLNESGYVNEPYIEGMINRENKFSTYIGNSVAIPHGENEVKDEILESGLVFVQYPEGVDFGSGNVANILIGIAGKGNEHLKILANVAGIIEDEVELAKLVQTTDVNYVHDLLSGGDQ